MGLSVSAVPAEMFLDTTMLLALVYGLISAVTLPLGAAVGLLWRPPDRVMAFLIAFGGGALLAALTIDLIAPSVERGHFWDLAIGAMLGGLLFKLLDFLVNRKGGYLRKPSTAMTYWRSQARKRLHNILGNLRRTQPLGILSDESEDKLLSIMLVQEFPAGTCLYRVGDPATNLYIIEEGKVELIDPQQGGKVFERLTRHDVFGRMSFYTGLHRATEAHTVRDTKLLIIPREPFMELLEDSEELRSILAGIIAGEEMQIYLQQRHDLSAEETAMWRDKALEDIAETGRFDLPIERDIASEDLVELLKNEQRLGFFNGLPDEILKRVADRLIPKSNTQGYEFFQMGQPADRYYLLREGTVYLLDPDDRTRKPTEVEAGESFGGLSFFTEGNHTATAISHEDNQILVLRHRDYEALLDGSPELRDHLSEFLKRNQIIDYLTSHHSLDPKDAANWISKAAQSVEGGKIFPSLSEMTRQVAGHEGAAMAIFLGILLDGIPESLVIGAHVVASGGISLSLISGLFLANFPEALSSAAGMKEQGVKITRILWMWTSLM
ncbi:MAG: cyclic nucleotide-binding domain-containing protein, partial [Pseudomonadota bacterium]|nr:cyclic nucleotide-binding domain-containing protein [Pseudomonadota bacterium]